MEDMSKMKIKIEPLIVLSDPPSDFLLQGRVFVDEFLRLFQVVRKQV